jgi:CO/xanthine dehydrogenase Mo-binding subunit
MFGIPLVRLRVIAGAIGGGFGGKTSLILEPFCILFAQLCSKPVKMELSRDEEFATTNPRHSIRFKLKTGVNKDGSFIGHKADLTFDNGAYTESGPYVVGKPTTMATGPYRIPNVQIDSRLVYTNRLASGSMRGIGVPQTTFAMESHLDLIARELSISPLELRLKNAFVEGDLSTIGQKLEGVFLKECIEEAAKTSGYGKKKGMGMACGQYPMRGLPGSANITVNHDGSIILFTGATDIGTGSRTVLLQIAAEELGIPFENAAIVAGDTELTPFDSGSGASRVTFITGRAVKIAAQDAKEQLLSAAAEMLEANPSDLIAGEGIISVKGSPSKTVTIAKAASHAQNFGRGPIMGRGSFRLDDPPYDQDSASGYHDPSLPCPTFSCHVAEVEVDEATGKVKVMRYTAAHDVGKAVNPVCLEGQIEGAIIQGMGFALSEELILKKGVVLNGSFLEYHIPTSKEMMPINIILIEKPDATGPYGAKGVGEQAGVPALAAVANAIHNAIGVRIKDLPITPDKILSALQGMR